MSDYEDILLNRFLGAQLQASGSMDEDPEQAARSLELSKASGVPAAAIHGDVEGFEQNHKAALASHMIGRNQYLQDYINSDPMNAKVSNDDWHNLFDLSGHLTKLGLPPPDPRAPHLSPFGIAGKAISKFKQSLDEAEYGDFIKHMYRSPGDFELAERHPIISGFLEETGLGVEVFSHLFSAGIAAAGAGAEEFGRQTGMEEQSAQRFGRDIGGMVEHHMISGQAHKAKPPEPVKPVVTPEHIVNTVREAYTAGKPWLDAGREPPPGTHPLLDMLHEEQAKRDAKALDDAYKTTQGSATFARSPETAAGFIRQHTEGTVGISADAVRQLYGDAEPEIEDGKLGWVPNIVQQLRTAEASGGYVEVPIADWLTKADPEVAKALHDEIRVRPNGVTLREAKEASKAEAPKAEERIVSPAVRFGNEVYTDIVHSLALQKAAEARGESLDAVLSKFEADGYLTSTGRYVDRGEASQIASKAKQIKSREEMAETSVRRQAIPREREEASRLAAEQGKGELHTEFLKPLAAEEEKPAASPAVQAIRQSARLDPLLEKLPEGWDKVEAGLEPEQGLWVDYGMGTKARLIPTEEMTARRAEVIEATNKVFERMVPRLVETIPVTEVTMDGRRVRGVFQSFENQLPVILWAVDARDTAGIARHEVIHHLRQMGFFSPEEWNLLRATAMKEKWIEKHQINTRYKGMGLGGMLEEAIADEFSKWRRQEYDQATGEYVHPPHVAGRVFEKLQRLLQGIKTSLRDTFGYEPNVEDLFHRVETGEIGSRRLTKPLHPKVMGEEGIGKELGPKASELTEEEKPLFEKAAAIGMTVRQFKKYQKLIAERNAEDVEAQTEAAAKDIRRRQTKEWKENEAKVLDEVSQDIRSRPDIASDRFFREGTLPSGEKLETKPRLDVDKLTEEQKAELHPHTYGKDGLHPDDVAGMFGYQSGEAMINRLRQLEQARQTLKKSPVEYLGKIIGDETERRMQQRFGDLNENVLAEAKDHVISPTQMDLLHEEVMALGIKAHGAISISKNDLKSWVKKNFDSTPVASHSTDRYLRQAGKAGGAAEMALLDGDAAGAFKAKQEQYISMLLATEAKRLERSLEQFEKNANQLKARSLKGYSQEYMNFIHKILGQVGKMVNRSVQDLDREIAKGANKTLEDFYWDKTEGESLEMPIPEFLFDGTFKKEVKDLTASEFNAIHQTIKTIKKLARDAQRVNDFGEKKDFNEVLNDQILPGMTRLPEKIRSMKERGIRASAVKWIKVAWAAHIGWETIANRMALDDPLGAWNRILVYPLADASLYRNKLAQHFAKSLERIPRPDDPNKLIDDHPFNDPFSRTEQNDPSTATRKMGGFTRDDALGALQVAGDVGAREKMFRGWGIKEEEFWPWLWSHVTQEDFNRAQKIGYIFERLKRLAERRDRELFGISPERVPIDMINTPWGPKEGWYHHVAYRADWAGTSQRLAGKDVLQHEGFISATGKKPWEKQRTGYAAPVDLSFDHIPTQIDQMIHDLAFREPIIQTQKFFRNQQFKNTMTKHFGLQYTDQLMPYLKALTNQSNINSAAEAGFNKLISFLRQNTIGNLIGLNLSTVLKHGPTALALSVKEVGVKNFAEEFVRQWGKDRESAEWNWKWAHDKFGEIALRDRHFQENIYGSSGNIIGRPRIASVSDIKERPGEAFMSMRDFVMRWSSKPVAASDLASARPTAMAEYKRIMREGVDHPEVGKLVGTDEDPAMSPSDFKKLDTIATTLANRAVRRAHGSTAITNKAPILRGSPLAQQFTSIYNFLSDMVQRRYENAWKAKEVGRTWKEGDHKAAKEDFVKDVLPGVFAYWIAPAIIEEWVSSRYDPEEHGRKRGFGERLITGGLHTLLSGGIVLRDLAYGFQPEHEVQFGIFSAMAKWAQTFKQDMFSGHAFDKANLGKTMEHTNTLLGGLTGLTVSHAGKAGRAMYDYSNRQAHPRTGADWIKLFETGTEKRGRHR